MLRKHLMHLLCFIIWRASVAESVTSYRIPVVKAEDALSQRSAYNQFRLLELPSMRYRVSTKHEFSIRKYECRTSLWIRETSYLKISFFFFLNLLRDICTNLDIRWSEKRNALDFSTIETIIKRRIQRIHAQISMKLHYRPLLRAGSEILFVKLNENIHRRKF